MDSGEDWKAVGEAIRRIREKKGMTQEALIKKMEGAKISPSTLSIIENGRRRAKPRASTLGTIAEALGVELEDLFPKMADVPAPSPPALQDIREVLLRYEPLRGLDQAVDRIIEQIQLWSVYYGRGKPQEP